MTTKLSEQQQENFFKKVLQREENNTCADCKVRGATWVSLDFGIFICINCSGVHRSFGMHITRVRSSKLDNWAMDTTRFVDLVGNKIANDYWESGRRDKRLRQIPDDERAGFIKQKYISKLWVRKNIIDPVSLLKEKNWKLNLEQMREIYSKGDSTAGIPFKEKSVSSKNNDFQNKPQLKFKQDKEKHKTKEPENIDLLDFDIPSKKEQEIKSTNIEIESLSSKKTNLKLESFDIDLFDTQLTPQNYHSVEKNSKHNPEIRKSHSFNIYGDYHQGTSDPFNVILGQKQNNTISQSNIAPKANTVNDIYDLDINFTKPVSQKQNNHDNFNFDLI